MLSTFCLRLACGMIGALSLLSWTHVNSRFFRTHFLVVVGLISLTAALDTSEMSVAYWLALGLAALFACLGSILWSLEGNPGGQAAALVCAVSLTVTLGIRAAVRTQGPELPAFIVVLLGEFTSAALLGTAMTAMLLGHFYLIAPGMSLSPLLRMLAALFVATGLRMALAGWGLWTWTGQHSLVNWEDETVLWLPVRWGLGFGSPLVLGWMARSAAKIRSTQSATGILYVVVILSFLGELTSQLLTESTGHLL